jgi:uncharacterized protein YbjT (DUF2867 family)
MTGKTILVTGATGNQGGAAATRLLADGWTVRALTRDPASAPARRLAALGAEMVPGDLADRGSLDAAVKRVHGVFSVQRGVLGQDPVSFEDEVRQGRNVTDAAAAAHVRHLVYASVAGAQRDGAARAFASKWEIEEYVRRSGVPATILRPVSFMENYADPAFGVQSGTLATPFAPEIPEQLIALDDIGAFVSLAFGNPAQYVGKAITLAGDELRPQQTAQALSRATGRAISYLQIPIETAREYSEESAAAAEFLNNNGGYGADITATRALHPGLLTFDAWLDTQGKAKLTSLFKDAI